jgi:hypothetical protein
MGRKGTRNLVRKLIPDSIRILGPPTSVLNFSNSTLYYGHFQFTLNILVFNCTCSSFRISRRRNFLLSSHVQQIILYRVRSRRKENGSYCLVGKAFVYSHNQQQNEIHRAVKEIAVSENYHMKRSHCSS